MKELYRRKIQSVYVEGGSSIHDAFLADGYWDQVITYLRQNLSAAMEQRVLLVLEK